MVQFNAGQVSTHQRATVCFSLCWGLFFWAAELLVYVFALESLRFTKLRLGWNRAWQFALMTSLLRFQPVNSLHPPTRAACVVQGLWFDGLWEGLTDGCWLVSDLACFGNSETDERMQGTRMTALWMLVNVSDFRSAVILMTCLSCLRLLPWAVAPGVAMCMVSAWMARFRSLSMLSMQSLQFMLTWQVAISSGARGLVPMVGGKRVLAIFHLMWFDHIWSEWKHVETHFIAVFVWWVELLG